ncbi:MAG: DUF3363 domain-containing protein [Achromobacter sp.]
MPWKPMIEDRLGHAMSATVRGGRVSWIFVRQQNLSP